MLTKQAAEKIAHEYYNVGQQLAMHEAGLIKEANALMEAISKLTGKVAPAPKASRLGKALKGTGIAGGLALTPGAYEGVAHAFPSLATKMPVSELGRAELYALQDLIEGNLAGAKGQVANIPSSIAEDASSIYQALQAGGKSLGEGASGAAAYLKSLIGDVPPINVM